MSWLLVSKRLKILKNKRIICLKTLRRYREELLELIERPSTPDLNSFDSQHSSRSHRDVQTNRQTELVPCLIYMWDLILVATVLRSVLQEFNFGVLLVRFIFIAICFPGFFFMLRFIAKLEG